MRRHFFTLLGLLVVAPALLAQGKTAPAPAPAPPPAGTPEQLAEVLARWEQTMAGVESLAANIKRTEVNVTWNRTKQLSGVAQYLRTRAGAQVVNRAIMHLANPAQPNAEWERFVCTGELLYQYAPSSKEIRVHKLPPQKPGQVGDDSFLSFLFGMKSDEARKRYDLTLQYPNDPNWVYLFVRPRLDPDKVDFQKARLTLDRKTFLPKQLWFEQPTGDHITWDIEKIQSGAQLDPKTFTSPETPAGWKVVNVTPRQAGAPARPEEAPRVIRQQQP